MKHLHSSLYGDVQILRSTMFMTSLLVEYHIPQLLYLTSQLSTYELVLLVIMIIIDLALNLHEDGLTLFHSKNIRFDYI